MQDAEVRRILVALAQGLDPATGRPFAPESPLAAPAVLEALVSALGAVEQRSATAARHAARPANGGRPWSESEDAELTAGFDAGTAVGDLARRHGRSAAGIEARLEKLGRLAADERRTRNLYARRMR